ncbi:MAG: hypothetical protein ACRDCT_07485 [Shewanella sp.]
MSLGQVQQLLLVAVEHSGLVLMSEELDQVPLLVVVEYQLDLLVADHMDMADVADTADQVACKVGLDLGASGLVDIQELDMAHNSLEVVHLLVVDIGQLVASVELDIVRIEGQVDVDKVGLVEHLELHDDRDLVALDTVGLEVEDHILEGSQVDTADFVVDILEDREKKFSFLSDHCIN